MAKFNKKGEFVEIKPEDSGLPFSLFIETAESRKKVSNKKRKLHERNKPKKSGK